MDKQLILNKIKEAYDIKSNAEFARRLGISPQNLSNWYNRNTFDENLILRKFTAVNEAWLNTGEGEMLKPAKNPFSQMTIEEIQSIAANTMAEDLIKLLKSGEIYLAEVHDRIVAEKNAEIEKRDKQIEGLRREIWELEKRLEDATK